MAVKPNPWHVRLIVVGRALAVGTAYLLVAGIPGITSTFIAVFVALLPYDLIVAMPRLSLRWSYWSGLVGCLLPRISATAITLGVGLLLGSFFGTLVIEGLPSWAGAVLVVGLAYSAAVETKGTISSYVGVLAGLALFDQIVRLDYAAEVLLAEIGAAALRMVYAAFTALFVGYLVGTTSGVFIRMLLPRGFRSLRSPAYAPPLPMRSFKEVTHLSDELAVVRIKVSFRCPWAGKTLAELALRTEYQLSVLSIYRQPEDVVAPTGSERLYPGDILVCVIPSGQVEHILQLAEGLSLEQV